MTVQEWQANQIESAAKSLVHVIAKTPADKQDWKPATDETSKTRSALDQAAECISVNRWFAATIRSEPPTARSDERPFTDTQDAQQQLIASAAELAGLIRGLSDDALDQSHLTPFGVMATSQLIAAACNNMQYHIGQVSFIQTLYGDMENHHPAEKS